jgi:ADP-heptose:LPS heptosyltransferase
MAGKMKLQQELALISNLDVMVSMDSGNAHIAAMLGVKYHTLGATHPYAGFTVPSAFRKYFVSDRNNIPCYPPPFMEIK